MLTNFTPGTSRRTGTLTTFRDQMSDYAQGQRLLDLRAAAHMSREDAAHEIGVTARALYVWEKKDGPIKWEHAQAAARVYGVEPESLVSREKLGGYGAQLDRIEEKLDELLKQREAPADQDAADRKRPLPAVPRKPKRATGGQ